MDFRWRGGSPICCWPSGFAGFHCCSPVLWSASGDTFTISMGVETNTCAEAWGQLLSHPWRLEWQLYATIAREDVGRLDDRASESGTRQPSGHNRAPSGQSLVYRMSHASPDALFAPTFRRMQQVAWRYATGRRRGPPPLRSVAPAFPFFGQSRSQHRFVEDVRTSSRLRRWRRLRLRTTVDNESAPGRSASVGTLFRSSRGRER